MGGHNNKVTGPSGSHMSPADQKSFAESLKGKSPDDLKNMLKDPNLTDEKKQMILDAMAEQAKKAETDAGQQPGQGDSPDIDALMKKLKDGTITDAELKQLADALHIDPEELQQENGKGEGSGSGGGNV